MIFDISLAILFLLGLFYFGNRRSSGVKTEEGYLLANRNLSLFTLTATLVMTELNTATLISFSSLGYLAGRWALCLPFVFLVSLLFYALSVAKKWKEFNGLSVASFFRQRYGKDVGILASCSLIFAMVGFSAAYVKSLTLLFMPLFPQLNEWFISGLLVLAVLATCLRGGLFSIIKADVFSFCIFLIFFPMMGFYAYRFGLKGSFEFEMPQTVLAPRFVISLIVLTMFTYILAPWYGQKIFAAKTKKIAFLSVIFSAIFVFALYGIAVLSTWFFRKGGGMAHSAELSLPTLISEILPKGLKGLGYAILFAASATTLSGVWSAMTSSVVGAFFKVRDHYRRSMVVTLAFALLSFLLANLLVDRVFDKLILANIPVAALSFSLLAGFYWKGASRFGAYLSIIIGFASGIVSYLFFGEAGCYTWYWAILGIPASLIFGVLGSLLIPNKNILISN